MKAIHKQDEELTKWIHSFIYNLIIMIKIDLTQSFFCLANHMWEDQTTKDNLEKADLYLWKMN